MKKVWVLAAAMKLRAESCPVQVTSLNFPPNTRGPNVAPNLAPANITQNTLRMPLVQVTNPTALLSKRLTYVCVAAM